MVSRPGIRVALVLGETIQRNLGQTSQRTNSELRAASSPCELKMGPDASEAAGPQIRGKALESLSGSPTVGLIVYRSNALGSPSDLFIMRKKETTGPGGGGNWSVLKSNFVKAYPIYGGGYIMFTD
jgi:hypothetical protein